MGLLIFFHLLKNYNSFKMSGFKFESEFKIVSEAAMRFYNEYCEIDEEEIYELYNKTLFAFITYSQLISKCMRRAKKLEPEKRKECLAYLKFLRKTDAKMNLHYIGVDNIFRDLEDLFRDVKNISEAVDERDEWLGGASNSRNRRWVRRHWDDVVFLLGLALEKVEQYKGESSIFNEEMRTLKQVAEDRKAELKEAMDRHYGLSKL